MFKSTEEILFFWTKMPVDSYFIINKMNSASINLYYDV